MPIRGIRVKKRAKRHQTPLRLCDFARNKKSKAFKIRVIRVTCPPWRIRGKNPKAKLSKNLSISGKKEQSDTKTFANLRLCEQKQKQKRSPNQSPNKYRGPKQTKLMFHLTNQFYE